MGIIMNGLNRVREEWLYQHPGHLDHCANAYNHNKYILWPSANSVIDRNKVKQKLQISMEHVKPEMKSQ